MELSKGELAVFDTNIILLEHLSAKLKSICCSDPLRETVVRQITDGLTNQHIVNLLQTDHVLFASVKNCPAYKLEKENIGEKLYTKVFDHEPNLAEKITGMILDLDLNVLQSVINNEVLLKQAIDKCKTTYYSYLQEAEYKENLGNKVFEIACRQYNEEVSSRLTGMLLELDTFQLEKLIIDTIRLQDKLNLCYRAYCHHYLV